MVSWRAAVDWSRFELVVIRSPWDYQDDVDRFLDVLARIDGVTRLENPLDVVRWNVRKDWSGGGYPSSPLCGAPPGRRSIPLSSTSSPPSGCSPRSTGRFSMPASTWFAAAIPPAFPKPGTSASWSWS